jgi:hypothetical protein
MVATRRTNSIPPLPSRRWFSSEIAVGVYSALPAALAATFTLEEAVSEHRAPLVIRLATVTLGAVLAGGLGKVLHGFLRDRQAADLASHLDFTACVYTVYLTIFHAKGLRFGDEADRKKLRITVHRVERDERRVTQLIDYVGAPGGGRGRSFPINGGVVGRVVTSDDDIAELHRSPQASWDEYRRVLQRDWAMLREQAEDLTRDRYDFLAVAIRGDDGGIVGVMYLDSTEPGFFDDATQDLVVAGCGGVAQYTKSRYGK